MGSDPLGSDPIKNIGFVLQFSSMNKVIHMGTDHAGFELKETIKQFLTTQNYTVIDHGATQIEPSDDYPDFIIPAVGAAIQNNERALVFGGSGLGEAIAANKVKGARAVVIYDEFTAIKSREHNDSNVLCLGERTATSDFELAKKLVQLWLDTPFSDDPRHLRRLQKISAYENSSRN